MKKIFKQVYKVAHAITLFLLILSVLLLINNNVTHEFTKEISKNTASIGFILLIASLSLKSIYFILKNFPIKGNYYVVVMKLLRTNNAFAKEQGLIIFNFFAIHSIIEIFYLLNNFHALYVKSLTVIIPVIILIYLEITSMTFIQKRFRLWKASHSIVWILPPLTVLHLVLLNKGEFKYIALNIFLFVIILLELKFAKSRGKKHLIIFLIAIIIFVIQFKIFGNIRPEGFGQHKQFGKQFLNMVVFKI